MLALQGDVAEHVAALTRAGCTATGIRTEQELNDCDALVLPGGESTTMGRLLRVFGLLEPLRQRLDNGLPCLATCAGLILLSKEVLDGRDDQLTLGNLDITTRRNAWGRQNESFEADLDVAGLAQPFHGVFIRAPRIESVGASVGVLATYNDEPVAVKQGNITALTFHPEMTHDSRIHEQFVQSIVKAAAA